MHRASNVTNGNGDSKSAEQNQNQNDDQGESETPAAIMAGAIKAAAAYAAESAQQCDD